jgi:DNA-binding CsgD family transcriptional regulator
MTGGAFAPLVARGDELRVVEMAVARLTEREGGALALVGPAGVGKSRLAREAASLAIASGATVLAGRAVTTGSSTAYRPLIEALAPWARSHGSEQPDLGAHGRALELLVPGAGPVGEALSPVFVAEAVLRLLPSIAAEAPVVLVLEDLHWADEETLAAVEYLADAAETLPLLIVVTARDDEGPVTRRLLRGLAARGAMRLLPLVALDPAAVRDLAELRLGQPISSGLLDLLVQRTDGLPLFVEELLAALDASGGLVRNADAVEISPVAGAVLPDTVADTVAARLDGIDDEQRRVLEAAALLGRAFDHDSLADGVDGDVDAGLQAGLALGLLQDDPDRAGQLRFRHALLRDGVIAATFPPRRAELARRLLELLTAQELTDDELAVAIDLAARAGDDAKAARLALRRAMNSFEIWAMATAEHGLAEARAFAGTDPDLLIELDVAQIRVSSIMGRLETVMRLGQALLSRLDPPGGRHDAELLETHLRLGQTLLDEEKWQEAAPHLEVAATLMHAADACQVTRLELWSSLLDRLSGDAERARARAVKAADLARPDAYQADLVCGALIYEGKAWLPDVETARARWVEALEYADTYSLRLWRARALVELAGLEADELAGDMSVDQALEEADALARECGGVSTRTRVALLQARLAVVRGELEVASAALVRAEEFGIASAVSRRSYADLRAVIAALRQEAVPDPTPPARVVAALAADDVDAARAIGTRFDPFSGSGLLSIVVDLVDDNAIGYGAVVDARALLPDLVAATERLAGAPLLAALFARLHATGALEDREPLQAAVALFDRIGLARPADACRAMLREAGVPLPRRSSAQDGVPDELRAAGVTTREMDVLRLIADGLTNKDVAAALYLSPRTVEKHVERLLMKTGAANRTALAAFARATATAGS